MIARHGTERCPEPEVLAAFLDGALDEVNAAAVRRHAGTCDACFDLLRESSAVLEDVADAGADAAAGPATVATVPDARSPEVRRRSRLPRWATAAAAILVVGMTFVGYRVWRAPDGLTRLARATADERPVEARLTGGAPWVSWDVTRGSTPGGTRSWRVGELAERFGTVEPERSPRDFHAGVLARFLRDYDTEDAAIACERAAAELNRLIRVASDPADRADASSDLAAVQLASHAATGEGLSLVAAQEAALRALEIVPGHVAATFNLALATERIWEDRVDPAMRGPEAAADVWERYLELDAVSGWAEEARDRIDRLARPERRDATGGETSRAPDVDTIFGRAIDRDAAYVRWVARVAPETLRLAAIEALLPRWARGVSAGEEAPDARAAVALAGEALRDATGDRSVLAAFEALDRTRGPGRSRLAEALVAFGSASRAWRAHEFEEAEALARDGEAVLRGASEGLVHLAEIHRANAEIWGRGHPAALARLDALDASIEASRSRGGDDPRSIRAKALWLRALMAAREHDLAGAIREFRAAIALFDRAGEPDNAAAARVRLAEVYHRIGLERTGWNDRRRGLSASGWSSAIRRARAIKDWGIYALDAGHPRAAMWAFERALAIPGDELSAADRADLELYAATADSALGRVDAGLARLRRIDLDTVPDDARPRVAANVGAALGRAWADGDGHGDGASADEALAGAIEYFSRDGRARLPELWLDRARARAAEGRLDLARDHVDRGIDEMLRVGDEATAVAAEFSDRAWDLFELGVALRIEAGRTDEALAMAEWGRRFEARASGVDDLEAVRADLERLPGALPRDAALVYFVALEDRLLSWWFRDGGSEHLVTEVSAEDLESLVRRVLDEIEGARGDDERRGLRASSELFDLLIRPFSSGWSAPPSVLYVAPDRALHHVPFAALLDRGSGRFLVEDTAVAIVRGAGFASSSATTHARERTGRAVLVGGPQAADFLGLPELPAAGSEISEIAEVYGADSSIVLTGAEATVRGVADRIAHAEVAHFATHAIAAATRDGRGALVLTPDAEEPTGLWTPAAIATATRDGAPRVVVLGACSTARGRIVRGLGPLSVAHPFLATGVEDVVGTLWDIEDRASSEVLVRFHRELDAGRSPADALRTAQLGSLHGSESTARSPRTWGGFVAIRRAPAVSGDDRSRLGDRR